MLPTSVIKELRFDPSGKIIGFIEITENCSEPDVLQKFNTWADGHAAKIPPCKCWNKKEIQLKRPQFLPSIVSFMRGVNGEFIIGITFAFWDDCTFNPSQRLVSVHRWLYKELNSNEPVDIPIIPEIAEFEYLADEIGGCTFMHPQQQKQQGK